MNSEDFLQKYREDIELLLDKGQVETEPYGAHSHWYTFISHKDSRATIGIDDICRAFNFRLKHREPRLRIDNDHIWIEAGGWWVFKGTIGILDCPEDLQKRLEKLVIKL